MIQVDDRAGSAQLAPKLRSLGCEVDLTRMDFGDVAFSGWGANGMPVQVGIEVKSLDDVIACITSGRFAGHQLPGLVQCFDHVYLLIQGQWRPRRRDGVLEYFRSTSRGDFWSEAGGGQRQWMWRDLEAWLNSMSIMGGLRVHRVPTYDEGAMWLKTLYNWFQATEHKSHLVIYSGKELYSDTALLTKPSLARRVAKELPSIGLVRSADVAHQFPTLELMVAATPRDWMKIEGVGKGIATKVYNAIHGLNGNGVKR